MEVLAKRITLDSGAEYVVIFKLGDIANPLAILTIESAKELIVHLTESTK